MKINCRSRCAQKGQLRLEATIFFTKKLQPRKVKQFLANKNAHKKGFLISFSRLKFIAYDINETWSLVLKRVYKHSKQNAGVQFLLISVDCFSRYLRVEPLKSKFAATSAEAFKQLIKHQQSKYFGWMVKQSLRRFQNTLLGKKQRK